MDDNNTTATVDTAGAEETITMSKADFDKQVKSEADRVRRTLSDKIAEYKRQIAELTPIKKTEAELDYEKRLAALEAREKAIKLKDDLTSNEVPLEFGDYLRDGADVKAFSEKYKEILKSSVDKFIKDNGFSPANHKSGESITREEFNKMDMTAKEKLYSENKELYLHLVGQK